LYISRSQLVYLKKFEMKKLCCILLCLVNGSLIYAQNQDSSKGNNSLKIAPERSPLLSNLSSRTAGVPNGWGNSSLTGGIGINFSSQAHSFTPNLVAVAGGGTDIFHRNLNLSGTINLNDVRLRNYSLDLKISKIVSRGSSISVGGIHPLFYSNLSGQPFQLYTAFSHAVQTLPSNTPGFSKLSYTIGLGSKNVDPGYISKPGSPKAKIYKSVSYFSSLSYEAFKNMNVNLGWSSNRGFNVGLTTSWTPTRRSLNPHSPITVTSPAPGPGDGSNCCSASKPVEAPNSFLRNTLMEKLKGADNISLDLYVMSQCPFGVKAEKALIPILKEIGKKATFNIFFIANETTEKEFKSLHGESEVMEDRRQLVIARHFPNKLLDYLLLRTSNYHSNEEWVKSANALGLDVNSINQLVNQKEEIEAFRTNISNSSTKKIFASPSLFINGLPYKGTFSLQVEHSSSKVNVPKDAEECTPQCRDGGKDCSSDEDCPGTCQGGANADKTCSSDNDCLNACMGGPNDGQGCEINEDCGGPVCSGGDNNNQPCNTSADCPDGSCIEPSCNISGGCSNIGACVTCPISSCPECACGCDDAGFCKTCDMCPAYCNFGCDHFGNCFCPYYCDYCDEYGDCVY
jgi:hypothetical protein